MTFDELLQEVNPKRVIGLSAQGIPSTCENVAQKLTDNSCIVIGGFPKGHFSNEIKKRFEYTVNVGLTSLEAHVVISRVLYEYEKTIFM
jgi:rRNA small subunit pseudouridine methyltransferase Nep1